MTNEIQIWFNLAESDLAASRVLHQSGLYRQSFFLFQQASEKANKGFLLLAEEVTVTELRKNSHAQLGIYKNITKKKREELRVITKTLEIFPHVQQNEIPELDFSLHQNTLNTAVEGFADLEQKSGDLNLKELEDLLIELKELEHVVIRSPKNFTSSLKNHYIQYADWLHKFGTAQAIEGEKELLALINCRKKFKELVDISYALGVFEIRLFFCKMVFFVCAMITNKHSTSTRYADQGADPEKIYTKKLPIVKTQLQFMKLLERAIKRLYLLNKEKLES